MEKIDAPLGSGRGRYAPRLDALTRTALTDLEVWFTEHPDSYVAISGGKDSTTCLSLARQVNPSVKAAFFDSGLEFPQTLTYIDRLRQQWGFELFVFPARPSALTVLVENGSWEHGARKTDKDLLHQACILKPLAAAQHALGQASIYGLRADESTTRLMMLSKGRGRVSSKARTGVLAQDYLAPIWRWSYEEVYTYLGRNSIPLNPIYRRLIELGVPERRARVGLLVDGWSMEQGRWALTRAIAPDLARLVESYLPALADYR